MWHPADSVVGCLHVILFLSNWRSGWPLAGDFGKATLAVLIAVGATGLAAHALTIAAGWAGLSAMRIALAWLNRHDVIPRRHRSNLYVVAPISLLTPMSVRALRLPGDSNGMATYTITPNVDQTGFDVAIVGNNGVRQTLLGFESQADAQAWIAWDKPHVLSTRLRAGTVRSRQVVCPTITPSRNDYQPGSLGCNPRITFPADSK
jgi:hypothetical protein